MRQLAWRVTAAALVAVILAALLPAPAQASTWLHVFIASNPAGTCLAIADAGEGTVPTHESCLDINNQLWSLLDQGVGQYRIVNSATGKCLATGSSSVVFQLSCDLGTAQLWRLKGTGHTFRISSVSVGNCIDRRLAGSSVFLGSCTPSGVSQWDLLF